MAMSFDQYRAVRRDLRETALKEMDLETYNTLMKEYRMKLEACDDITATIAQDEIKEVFAKYPKGFKAEAVKVVRAVLSKPEELVEDAE